MNNILLSIIDDHAIVRQGLKDLLEKLGGFTVVSEFENGQQFIASLPQEDKIDVYILDYSMPKMTGIDVLKHLETLPDEYRVLLLTQHFDESIINDAYNYGARGFLNKNCSAHDLKFALENIVKIGYNNVSEILKRIKNYEIKDANKSAISLTSRELEFLKLVCNENEYTYEQMAELIGVSVKSIDGYRTNLFEKFNIKSKVGLVLFSFKNKLTEPFL
ncbi:response regulator [Flavobacterium sp.]|uniref:response regulator transcription factor n=1 Tax=Flavobacterium sp. TaxID=239 RepID=UPI0037500C15